LAYAQQAAADINVWRAELPAPGVPARNPICLISSSLGDYHPAYSPDGKKIAFVSFRAGKRSIWLCEQDGSKAAQLSSLGGWGPSWSPDSQRIAFASNADGGFPLTELGP
jgi:TolB protein